MRGPYPGDLRVRVIKLSLWKQEDPDVALPNTLRSARVPRSAGCNAFAKMGRANRLPVEGVAFGAAANHCGFYVMSGTVLQGFRDELAECKTSKSTIRFTPDRPLPSALVKRIVRARIAENHARLAQRAKRGATRKQPRSE
jgi:hypothetical protein